MSRALTKEPGTAVPDQLGAGDLGAGEFNRRLSDKILSAFNHAYAIGAVEIAEKLKTVLKENEHNSGPLAGRRRSIGALSRRSPDPGARENDVPSQG